MTHVLENEVVVAGAGTGKTHALVNAYLFTLLGLEGSGTPRSPHRVLAITFTDKAAAEMRRRVAMRLAALARAPGTDAEVLAQAERTGTEVPPTPVLERLLRYLPGAPIQTFHSLAAALLRDLALPAGLDPGFELLDEVEERYLLQESAEAVIIDRLTAADESVAELAARFQLRRLGGGRGLVELLVEVYSGLAERGLTAELISPVTERDKAEARVKAARVELYEGMYALRQLLNEGGSRFTKERAATLGVAFDRFREAFEREGPDRETEIASAFKMLARADGNWGDRDTAAARKRAFGALYELGAALCDEASCVHTESVRALLAALDDRVSREKEARGVLSFGDLLIRLRDLLRDEPGLRARVKARFERILVDEYQDTSPVQEDVVAFLAEEPTRGDRVTAGEAAMGVLRLAPGRLFVVGDPKQSIYGFRGADARLFAHTLDVITKGTDALAPTGSQRPLNKNYRSRPPVIDFVNLVAEATLSGTPYGVRFSEDDALLPHREGEGLAGALWRPTEAGGLDLDEQEAWVIARGLRALLDEGATVSDEDRPCRPRDMAVLVRRIRTAGPIARALAHVGIPSHVTGGEGFFVRPEVMDLISTLRLLAEPLDELAALTVLRSPLCALADDDIVGLYEAAGQRHGLNFPAAIAALEASGVEDEAAARVRALGALLDELRQEIPRATLHHLFDALVARTGFARLLAVAPDATERWANVEKLRAMCEGRAGEAIAQVDRLWTFLDSPPREGPASVAGPEVDAVRIMTVHQSKGLEFPIVVVADCGSTLPNFAPDIAFEPDLGLAVSYRGRPIAACAPDGNELKERNPGIKRIWATDAARGQAELARLLYVALTRARDRVFLVGEERNSGAPGSLRRLIEKSRTLGRARFDALCPTVKLPGYAPPSIPLPEDEVPALVRFEPVKLWTLPRVLPSHLEAPGAFETEGGEDEASALDEVAARIDPEARVRGRLGHALLARATEELDAVMARNEDATRELLEVTLRCLGEDPATEWGRSLVERCLKTIRGPIASLLEEGYALSFEEPVKRQLRYRGEDGASRDAVVQGVADLVARTARSVYVADFKSSSRAAQAESTWLQLYAYAAALDDGRGAVKCAAWVIGGAPQASDVRPFDDAAAGELHAALAAHARRDTSAGGGAGVDVAGPSS